MATTKEDKLIQSLNYTIKKYRQFATLLKMNVKFDQEALPAPLIQTLNKEYPESSELVQKLSADCLAIKAPSASQQEKDRKKFLDEALINAAQIVASTMIIVGYIKADRLPVYVLDNMLRSKSVDELDDAQCSSDPEPCLVNQDLFKKAMNVLEGKRSLKTKVGDFFKEIYDDVIDVLSNVSAYLAEKVGSKNKQSPKIQSVDSSSSTSVKPVGDDANNPRNRSTFSLASSLYKEHVKGKKVTDTEAEHIPNPNSRNR